MPYVAYENGCKGNAIVTLARGLCRGLRQDGCRRSRARGYGECPKKLRNELCGRHAFRPILKVTTMLLLRPCASCSSQRTGIIMNTKTAAIGLSLVCVVSVAVQASTLTVTNTNDNGPGSLRQALVNANVGDRIDATGISGVITLTSGELLVNNSVTINGSGADLLVVDGNGAGTVFRVMSMGPVRISGLTIRNAHGNFGGGIFNGGVGTLTIINSALSGNTAAFGGVVYNGGTLNIGF